MDKTIPITVKCTYSLLILLVVVLIPFSCLAYEKANLKGYFYPNHWPNEHNCFLEHWEPTDQHTFHTIHIDRQKSPLTLKGTNYAMDEITILVQRPITDNTPSKSPIQFAFYPHLLNVKTGQQLKNKENFICNDDSRRFMITVSFISNNRLNYHMDYIPNCASSNKKQMIYKGQIKLTKRNIRRYKINRAPYCKDWE